MRLAAVAAALALAFAPGCEPHVAPPPPPPAGAVTALFDPTATPPVVPTPTDLAFVGGDGTHLNVPDLPTDSPAQRAFNAYLRTLTGFPSSSTATAQFSGPIDPASVSVQTTSTPGSIVVVDTTTGMLVGDLFATVGADGASVVIVNRARWQSGHRYAVMLFGNEDPTPLRSAAGGPVLASPTFFFLRSPVPLLARCGDLTSAACACPMAAVLDPNDTTCHSSVQGLTDAQARQAEPQRAQVDAALTQLLPLAAPGRSRSNLALFWTFTITSQPMAVFDPTGGDIPFPNDVLIDPSTGKVALPIAPGDPQAALKMALDTLDGFSVSAAETVGVDLPSGVMIDAASLAPNFTTFLINLDPSPSAPQPTFTAVPLPGLIALEPDTALIPDQRRYAVVLTRFVTAAGVPLVPAPTTALELQPNPVFDGMHSTVSQLSDAEAQQLEKLRVAMQPLLTALDAKGLPRDAIAAVWTFTTQSIERPLAALDAFPTLSMIPTNVNATVYTNFSALPAGLQPFVADVRAVVLGTFTSYQVYEPGTRAVQFQRTPSPSMPTVPQADIFVAAPSMQRPITIHFWMTIPKNSPGPGGAPVVVAQHGITRWRGDVFTLGEDFAKGGRATIGFDIDFHGARTRCTADTQCASGAAGSCDVTTGVCAGGLAPAPTSSNPLACDLAAFSGDTATDCMPAASGNTYVDPANLFGARAGGFQYVVDAAQLVRVLRATGDGSLETTLANAGLNNAFDPTTLSFLGVSLGGINAAVFLATDPSVAGANVLNVAGGHLFEILADSPSLHGLVDPILAGMNITRGTPAYFQLTQEARWILDPIDPWSVARTIARQPSFSYVTMARNAPKLAVVQEAGMDTVIPPQYEADLSSELWFPDGVDVAGHAQGKTAGGALVSTFFADATHGTLLSAMPSPSMRVQAVTYILSGGATLPAP